MIKKGESIVLPWTHLGHVDDPWVRLCWCLSRGERGDSAQHQGRAEAGGGEVQGAGEQDEER